MVIFFVEPNQVEVGRQTLSRVFLFRLIFLTDFEVLSTSRDATSLFRDFSCCSSVVRSLDLVNKGFCSNSPVPLTCTSSPPHLISFPIAFLFTLFFIPRQTIDCLVPFLFVLFGWMGQNLGVFPSSPKFKPKLPKQAFSSRL